MVSNDSIELEIIRLSIPEDNEISVFVGQLIIDLFDKEALNSIGNHLLPSIFIPLEPHSFTLYYW